MIYDVESLVERPTAWTWADYRIGYVLWVRGPCESNEIASLAGIGRAAVSVVTRTLLQQGFVIRADSETDGRSHIYVRRTGLPGCDVFVG